MPTAKAPDAIKLSAHSCVSRKSVLAVPSGLPSDRTIDALAHTGWQYQSETDLYVVRLALRAQG